MADTLHLPSECYHCIPHQTHQSTSIYSHCRAWNSTWKPLGSGWGPIVHPFDPRRPVPLWDWTMTSRPFKMGRIARCWTADGRSKPGSCFLEYFWGWVWLSCKSSFNNLSILLEARQNIQVLEESTISTWIRVLTLTFFWNLSRDWGWSRKHRHLSANPLSSPKHRRSAAPPRPLLGLDGTNMQVWLPRKFSYIPWSTKTF